MKKYKHLFFDLDHTLWDFDKNSRETLLDLHGQHGLASHGIEAEDFVTVYFEINTRMWDLYHRNLLDRETLRYIRFEKTFERFSFRDEAVCRSFPEAYLSLLPGKKHLLPGAEDVLARLGRAYVLHLITNGFGEVQETKLSVSGLAKYFTEIIISDRAGFKKPEKEIFEFALKRSGSSVDECLMIGDDPEADVRGALEAGWDVVFFNPGGRTIDLPATFEIRRLEELHAIL